MPASQLLIPDQLSYPIFSDQNWAEACLQETKGSCCSTQKVSSMALHLTPVHQPHLSRLHSANRGEEKRRGSASDLQSTEQKATLNCGTAEARKYLQGIFPTFIFRQVKWGPTRLVTCARWHGFLERLSWVEMKSPTQYSNSPPWPNHHPASFPPSHAVLGLVNYCASG